MGVCLAVCVHALQYLGVEVVAGTCVMCGMYVCVVHGKHGVCVCGMCVGSCESLEPQSLA